MKKLPYILLGGGFALWAVSAIIGWILAPMWIKNRLTEEAKLSKLSPNVSFSSRFADGQDKSQIVALQKRFKEWVGVEAPYELNLKIFLFNVTNPDEIKKGEKPILNEVGPFVYRRENTKVNITVNEANDTIKYNEMRRYYFVPELSSGKEEDLVTIINIPFVGLAREISKLNKWIRYTMTLYLDNFNEQVFLTKTVNEFLFGGYYQAMVASLSRLTATEYLPNNTFGIFHGKNGTDYGQFEIYSGGKNISKFGEISSWNGKKKMEWWETDNCNTIEGTDGPMIFPPFITKQSVLKIFNPDLCRALPLEFSEVVDYNGVETYRFVATEKPYQDPKVNPDNMCFCTQNPEDSEDCPADGAYQVSACRKDAPIYMSMPHFLFGPSYARQSEGFHPDREKHQTFIEVEPITGTVLQARFRDQASVQLEPHAFHKGLNQVPHVLMPFVWQEESVTITSEAKLYSIIRTPALIATAFSSVGMGVAVSLVLIALFIFILRARDRIVSL